MKNKLLLIITILVVVTGWFYWFQIRPSNIKKECQKFVVDKSKDLNSIEQANFAYSMCLHSKGL